MPVPPPPNEGEVADCAVAHLLDLNGVHYYETINCADPTITGLGFSEDPVPATGCEGFDDCPSKNIVTPLRRAVATKIAADEKSSFDEMTEEEARQLRLSAASNHLSARPAFPRDADTKDRALAGADMLRLRYEKDDPADPTPPNDVDLRRQGLTDWLIKNIAGLTFSNVDDRFFWTNAMKRLRRVSVETTNGEWVTSDDKPFVRIKTVKASDIPVVVATTKIVVEKAQIPKKTAGGNHEYVKVRVRRPRLKTAREVYFRLFNVKTKSPVGFRFDIGQQIEKRDVPPATLPEVAEAKLLDRHNFFHVLEVDEVDAARQNIKYHVYTANPQEFREFFV